MSPELQTDYETAKRQAVKQLLTTPTKHRGFDVLNTDDHKQVIESAVENIKSANRKAKKNIKTLLCEVYHTCSLALTHAEYQDFVNELVRKELANHNGTKEFDVRQHEDNPFSHMIKAVILKHTDSSADTIKARASQYSNVLKYADYKNFDPTQLRKQLDEHGIMHLCELWREHKQKKPADDNGQKGQELEKGDGSDPDGQLPSDGQSENKSGTRKPLSSEPTNTSVREVEMEDFTIGTDLSLIHI